jgi:hypothetical protein
MKEVMMLICVALFFPPIVLAQDKVESPVLNIGDTWSYKGADGSKWTQKVIDIEDDIYVIRHGNETRGYNKSTMNFDFFIEDGRRVKFTGPRSKVLDFPLFVGKKWHKLITQLSRLGRMEDYREEYFVQSYEEVSVEAGTFTAFKINYKSIRTKNIRESSKGDYWYSPEVKAIVKRVEEKSVATHDMELISFKLNRSSELF